MLNNLSNEAFPFAINTYNPYNFGTFKRDRITFNVAKLNPTEPITEQDGSITLGTVERELHIYDRFSMSDVYIICLKNSVFRPYHPVLQINHDIHDINDSKLDFFRNKKWIEYRYHMDNEIDYFIPLSKEEFDENKETIFKYMNKIFTDCTHYKKCNKFIRIL